MRNVCLDPGLQHERVFASVNVVLLCLAHMLRKELRDFESANATLAEDGNDNGADELAKQLAALREETRDLEEDFGIDSVL
jgi:hypothetical protein